LIRGVLKNRNSIGEIGNPYGIPISTCSTTLVLVPNVKDINLFIKKLPV